MNAYAKEDYTNEHDDDDNTSGKTVTTYFSIIEALRLYEANIKDYLVDDFHAAIKGITDYSVFESTVHAKKSAPDRRKSKKSNRQTTIIQQEESN